MHSDLNGRRAEWLARIEHSEQLNEMLKNITQDDFMSRKSALEAVLRNNILNDEVEIDLAEGVIFKGHLRERVTQEIFLKKGYELELSKFIVSYLNPGDHFIDVGAHYGYHSLIAATLVEEDGKVLSVEPVPDNYMILKNNVNSFRQVDVVNAAAWHSDAQLEINVFGSELAAFSTLASVRLHESEIHSRSSIQVKAVPLDGIVESKGLHPKLIKIDVEGAEWQVLQGLSHTIERYRPALTVEVGDLGSDPEQITSAQLLERIIKLGYKLFEPVSGQLIPHEVSKEPYSYGNIVALPVDSASSLDNKRIFGMDVMRDKQTSLDILYAKGFDPKLCIDVGAAEGTEGLYNSERDWLVLLLEPSPSYLPALALLSDKLGSAKVIHGIASAKPGTVKVGMEPNGGFFTDLENKPADWPEIELEAFTVDGLVEEHCSGVGMLQTLLKIDVDGAELDVLAGAEALISKGAVVIIEAVLLDGASSRFERIFSWFLMRNYAVVDIVEPLYRPIDQLLWQVDLVFVPREAFRDQLNIYQ